MKGGSDGKKNETITENHAKQKSTTRNWLKCYPR